MFRFQCLVDLQKEGIKTTLRPKKSRRKKSIEFKLRLHSEQCGLCAICKQELKIEESNIDHKIPLSKGGTNEENNLQLTHIICNLKKGNKI